MVLIGGFDLLADRCVIQSGISPYGIISTRKNLSMTLNLCCMKSSSHYVPPFYPTDRQGRLGDHSSWLETGHHSAGLPMALSHLYSPRSRNSPHLSKVYIM